MSYEAERWARAQVVGNSTAKYVLRELACCHNGKTGLCCPSISALCKVLEIKKDETVLKAITHLEARGLLARTFERGDKGNITRTLYRFPTFSKEEWLGNELQKTEYGYPENQSTVLQKKEEGTPENGEGCSDFGGSGCSEKRSVTMNIEQGNEQGRYNKEEISAPVGAHTPSLESGQKKEKKPRKKAKPLVKKPDGVDQRLWDDWMVVRKAKRAPMTETAWEDMVLEAKKAGLELNEAIKICVVRNWRGFQASWNWQGTYSSLTKAQSNPSTKGFVGDVKTDPSKPEEWGNTNEKNKKFLKMVQQHEKDGEELPF